MIFDTPDIKGAPPSLRAFAPTNETATAEEGEGYSFWDLLDVVNPLQHIPVVSTIYRHLSGDEIKAPAQLAGGFLFGGVVGLASSAVNIVIEAATGDDVGGHVMSLIDTEETADPGAKDIRFARANSAYARDAASGTGYVIDTPR